MSITTANELRTAVASWVNDTSIDTTKQNECIALFEAYFNRTVRVKGMEGTMSPTALSSGALSNPSGFLSWKELRLDGTIDYTLQPKPLEWIRAHDNTDTSDAVYYAVTSSQTVCWPTGGTLTGTYYKSLTSLTGLTTTANWLLTSHPDLYMAGTLMEAFLYLRDEEGAALWGRRRDAIIGELERNDQSDDFGDGPIAATAR